MAPNVSFSDPAGPPGAEYLLLGHSLGTSATLWADAAPYLEESFRVVRWELPGHGGAGRSTSFTIGDLADDIAAHIGTLDDAAVNYAGVSLGGVVGLDLVARHPEVIRRAALISAGAYVDSPAGWRERANAVRAEGTASLVAGSRERWFSAATREQNPEVVERLLGALADTDDEGYALTCEALADYDARELLPEVTTPILAGWGEFDVLVPEAKSVELATGVRHGTVRRVDGVAHAAPAERPADVSRLLIDFFGQ